MEIRGEEAVNSKMNPERFGSRREIEEWLWETGRARTAAEAGRWMREHLPSEKECQAKILAWLKEQKAAGAMPRLFFWKQQAGPYQRQGLPDIAAIIDGEFWAFEIKRPFIGKLTAIQEETIRQINEAGGRAFVVSTVAEVRDLLVKAGKITEVETVG